MKRTTRLAVVVTMTATIAFANQTLAMRDPGPEGLDMPGVQPPPRAGQAGLGGQYTDGMSLYQYVRSNPIVGLDPTGLKAVGGRYKIEYHRRFVVGGLKANLDESGRFMSEGGYWVWPDQSRSDEGKKRFGVTVNVEAYPVQFMRWISFQTTWSQAEKYFQKIGVDLTGLGGPDLWPEFLYKDGGGKMADFGSLSEADTAYISNKMPGKRVFIVAPGYIYKGNPAAGGVAWAESHGYYVTGIGLAKTSVHDQYVVIHEILHDIIGKNIPNPPISEDPWHDKEGILYRHTPFHDTRIGRRTYCALISAGVAKENIDPGQVIPMKLSDPDYEELRCCDLGN